MLVYLTVKKMMMVHDFLCNNIFNEWHLLYEENGTFLRLIMWVGEKNSWYCAQTVEDEILLAISLCALDLRVLTKFANRSLINFKMPSKIETLYLLCLLELYSFIHIWWKLMIRESIEFWRT